jgi:hypothetical protein
MNIKCVGVHMSNEAITLVFVNLVAFSWFLSFPSLNLGEVICIRMVIMGWRR